VRQYAAYGASKYPAIAGCEFCGGDAQPNTLKQITRGVWFRQGDEDQRHCNNVIIEMRDYLIIVDADFPSGARLALADAKKVSSKPVKFVFDARHHGDHTYGNAAWTGMGAMTIAYQGVAGNEALRTGALADDHGRTPGRGGDASQTHRSRHNKRSPIART
jgi:glyoxylase-like metal-dependent hydrolase (beta-lactamase superfamily II)